MLQRQIMFKQLEELHRQKKLQELNDSRQQNVINQPSLLHNKQASGGQYAPLINGTPIRDPSQMFMLGNPNLVHGFQNGSPYSQGPNQVLHSINLASQQVDGTPISNPGHSFSRFSHFQGVNRESNGEQFNVPYQERNLFGSGFNQTGNEQQEFGNVSEKASDINPSEEFTSLDPLEQKFLFNSDDNSLGGFGNLFEDNDNSQSFPSLQSGSWSALMQSALEETSSTDTGVQEEWSGLSFQNPELSNDNQPSNFMEGGKNPASWQNNIFQNASTLKTSNAGSGFPGFQQFPPTHFQLRSDSSHESNQQPRKETGEFEGSTQVQTFSPLQVHQGLSGHGGEFEFVNDASNNGREFKKGFLVDNQRHSKASELTNFRSNDSSGMSTIVDRSAGFPAPDSNAQTSRHMLELLHKVDKFREYRHGSYTDSAPTNEMPKTETDAFIPPNNSSTPQYFGLRLAPPTSRPPANYFDISQISQQVDTSHIVPLKNQDGQRSLGMGQQVSNSTRQANVWVDIPSQQSLSGIGLHKAQSGSPSTSDVANNRMETTSEAPKEGGNDLAEHVMNSQGFDYGRGQEGKTYSEEESFSGRVEANAFGHSLKQANVSSSPHGFSPLNPTHPDLHTRTVLKNEDTKLPQVTSMSQMTSAYENYRALLTTREDQMVKNSSHPPLQDVSQLLHRNNSFVQMNLASTSSQYGNVWSVTGTNALAVNQQRDVPNQELLVSKSKKRKLPTYELLPWHKEATKGSPRVHDMSIAELEWAQAAKRVPEQLKEEGEALRDSPWVHPKKRLILTTQLMQVLFRPAAAAIISEDVTACYKTVTYFAARLALGDACSLANHPHLPCDTSELSSGENTIFKGSGDQNLSKIIQDLLDRSKKLEDELLRLENGGSILEIRMESQDLERFSVINRFAKFHSRAHMVAAAESASSGGVPKLFPQRYVAASPMPKIVPEGHNCLSL